MRKFIVKFIKGEWILYEVELELVPSMCEPGMKPGEWKARVLKPNMFHMKRERIVDGKKEIVYEPDVWYSHAFYDDKGAALAAASKLIEQEFSFNKRKYGTEYTDADLAAAFLAIKVVML